MPTVNYTTNAGWETPTFLRKNQSSDPVSRSTDFIHGSAVKVYSHLLFLSPQVNSQPDLNTKDFSRAVISARVLQSPDLGPTTPVESTQQDSKQPTTGSNIPIINGIKNWILFTPKSIEQSDPYGEITTHVETLPDPAYSQLHQILPQTSPGSVDIFFRLNHHQNTVFYRRHNFSPTSIASQSFDLDKNLPPSTPVSVHGSATPICVLRGIERRSGLLPFQKPVLKPVELNMTTTRASRAKRRRNLREALVK